MYWLSPNRRVEKEKGNSSIKAPKKKGKNWTFTGPQTKVPRFIFGTSLCVRCLCGTLFFCKPIIKTIKDTEGAIRPFSVVTLCFLTYHYFFASGSLETFDPTAISIPRYRKSHHPTEQYPPDLTPGDTPPFRWHETPPPPLPLILSLS